MNERGDQEQSEQHDESVANPFAIGDEDESTQQKVNLSPRRAAMLGLMVGLISVGLLLICFLGSVALAACTEV